MPGATRLSPVRYGDKSSCPGTSTSGCPFFALEVRLCLVLKHT